MRPDSSKFLVRFSPITAALANARSFHQLDGWCRDLEASHQNVRVALPAVLPYDQSLMWDYVHLNARGVEAFMPVVAKDVQAALGR